MLIASAQRSLAVGDRTSIDVGYCPQDLGGDTGLLVIETANPDQTQKSVSVPLSGSGGGPDAVCSSTVIDFGQVSLFAPARRTVSVQNVGHDDLVITQVVADTVGTGAFSSPAAGAVIPIAGFLDITVEFQPLLVGGFTSQLLISTNDRDQPEKLIELIGEGVALPPCTFEVVPPALNFGAVERGRTASRAFEIRNIGSADCLVTSSRLQPGTGSSFALPDGDVRSLIVPPSTAATIRVDFTPPLQGAHAGNTEFSISNPTMPFNTVPLSGEGVESGLLITPNELDFGVQAPDCTGVDAVTIYNTGSLPAQIDAVSVAPPGHPAFEVAALQSPLPTAPLMLAPGASTRFDVRFAPQGTPSTHATAVEIEALIDGQSTRHIVGLLGRSGLNPVQVDEFTQLPHPKVDLLFVIDDSCSMTPFYTGLTTNLQAFMAFLVTQPVDYQIGVTTTDIDEGAPAENGRLVPLVGSPAARIVGPMSSPSPESVFAANIDVGIDSRTFTGRGIDAAFRALSNPLLFGHNAGFLRSDASLSVVFISDDDDRSSAGIDFYVNFFHSIKGFRNQRLFSASAIVIDGPDGCRGPGGIAGTGARYIDLARRTGGVVESICATNWAAALQAIPTTAAERRPRFALSQIAVASTIAVIVDGAAIPASSPGGVLNWRYEAPTNAVVFAAGAIPPPGAVIRVEYVHECR